MHFVSSRTETEIAPFLRVFGELAPRMAQILRADSYLATRLTFAPRRVIHSIGAYLHVAADPDAYAPDLAMTVAETHPRDLLRAAIPDAPATLYRALDRTDDRVYSKRYYEQLGSVCRGPFAERFLQSESIGPHRLNLYTELADFDPITQRLAMAMPEESSTLQYLDSVVRYLRTRMLLKDDDVDLDKKAGAWAVIKVILNAVDEARAPEPPFSVPPSLRLVRTARELREIGKRFQNCVSSYDSLGSNHCFKLAEGLSVYLVSDDPPFLVALSRAAPGLWWIEEAAGPRNTALSPSKRSELTDMLRDAGVTLAPYEPVQALSWFVGRFRRNRRRIEDDLANLLGEDDVEAVLG